MAQHGVHDHHAHSHGHGHAHANGRTGYGRAFAVGIGLNLAYVAAEAGFGVAAGSLDIELNDGTTDEEYLAKLAEALPEVIARSSPELVMYVAGADPHEGDVLGRLSMTFDGLARRDAFVLELCREVGLPVALTIAGGYGRHVEDTVRIHLETARIASRYATASAAGA